MKISPARQIAFDVLLRVERELAFASDLLHEALDENVSRADAALATELSLGVLRWQRELDFRIAAHSNTPLAKLDLEVLIALRLGVYQLRHLARVPAHAAINESVELVKAARKSSAAPLVNAILRKIAERQAQRPKLATEADITTILHANKGVGVDLSRTDSIAILGSHPTWLAERWISRWGEVRAAELMVVNNEPPRTTIALHDPAQRDAILSELQSAGLRVEPGRWLREALTISGGSVITTAAWRDGRISIQDEASQMVARLLDVRPGDAVLDVCAAPGGKTMTLARAAAHGRVIACDFHWHRLHAMQQRMRDAHLANVPLVTLNAAAPLPFSAAANFNRILVDAPCTGTGTLARNPEIRWRLRPEVLPALRTLQIEILRNSLDALAPGGRLVYSTCSLEPEENEQVVEVALRDRPGVQPVSGAGALAPHLIEPTLAAELFDSAGYFRTFPPDHATDGFFAAILEKN